MSFIGGIIVFACVIGGYVLHGGHVAVLIQIEEFIVIGGAALGSLVISSTPAQIKRMIALALKALKGGHVNKAFYLEVLNVLYELFKKGKGNLVELEKHIEKPAESEIFKKYPHILHDHHVMPFLSDTLKTMISSSINPYDLEDLLDQDIQAAHAEEHIASATVNRIGDAMPGLGIVAAVLGVVITMGKLDQGKEVIGKSVAAALVGTFIGILVSYGYFQPVAAKMDLTIADEGKVLEVIKVALVAFAKDCNPKVCVEFARRNIPPEFRPTFEEVEASTSNTGKAAA